MTAFEYRNVALAVLGEGIVDHLADMSGAEVKVLLVYALRFNGSAGSAFPSLATLAAQTGLNRRTVQRARQQLEERGMLAREAGRPGASVRFSVDECRRFSSRYRATKGLFEGGGVETAPFEPGGRRGDRPGGGVETALKSNGKEKPPPPPPGEPEAASPADLPSGGGGGGRLGEGGLASPESVARWLCGVAGRRPPSDAQIGHVRSLWRAYGASEAESLRSREWCSARLEEALSWLRTDARRQIGLCHAFAVKAEQAIESHRRLPKKRDRPARAPVPAGLADARSRLRIAEAQIEADASALDCGRHSAEERRQIEAMLAQAREHAEKARAEIRELEDGHVA